MDSVSFPPLEELLPHRGPALWLDSVLEWSAAGVTCQATLTASFPYVREGCIDVLCGLEILAQSVAAYTALRRRELGQSDGHSPIRHTGAIRGYLAGIPRAEFRAVRLPIDVPLTARVEPMWQVQGAARFRGRLESASAPLMTAELHVVERAS